VVDIPDVVKYTNFGDHRLRGFWGEPRDFIFGTLAYHSTSHPAEKNLP